MNNYHEIRINGVVHSRHANGVAAEAAARKIMNEDSNVMVAIFQMTEDCVATLQFKKSK